MGIDWSPCSDRPGSVEDSGKDELRWIEGHPVIFAQRCVALLRFTSAVQLARLLAALASRRGPISVVTVLRQPKRGPAAPGLDDGSGEFWFLEGCVLVVFQEVMQKDWD
jgi:hypothetical protein